LKGDHNVDSHHLITLFKKFDEKQAAFEGDLTFEKIEEFVSAH